MATWKPIGTLKIEETPSGNRRSADVLLWVKSADYVGPIVGCLMGLKAVVGFVATVQPSAVSGYDTETDFDVKDVTHWSKLPTGPKE